MPANKPSHLVFVIHGMGYAYGMDSKDSTFAKNLQDLRQNSASTLFTEFNDEKTNLEWIPISWHQKLHSLKTVERIKSITLPTCSMMRNVANDILADVMYYFTAFHGQAILDICCEMLNDEYRAFMERNPGFKGKVSIFAHSLGSIIAYDLLANQDVPPRTPPEFPVRESHGKLTYPKLNFTPDFLFMVGSPLGAVIIQRGQELTNYQLPSTQCFNLFNLYDPLAYRLEPLLDSRFTDISPVLCQRPRVDMTFELGYYKEMVYAYLPDLSGLPSLPNMPSFSTTLPTFSSSLPTFSSVSTSLPTIPSIPTIPMPTMPKIPPIPKLPSLSLEKLFPFLSSTSPLLPLNLPSNSLLESAQSLLQSQINRLFSPVLGGKRKLEEDDDDHVDKKRDIDRKAIPIPSERVLRSPRSKKPDSIKTLETNLLTLSSELTSRLVSQASKAEQTMEPEIKRLDYFLQDELVSVARQYYLGMNAHFGYWKDKDLMHFLLKKLGC